MNWEKFRNNWGFRSLAFIGRMLMVLLFLGYLIVGISAVLTLVNIGQNRRQTLDALPALIQKAAGSDRPGDVAAWARFRPLAETAGLIEIIKPESGSLGPDIFFELSRRELLQNHPEEALFWSQLARYRLRYDILRCGAAKSSQTLEKILGAFASPKIQDILQQHPDLVKKSVRRVLDFDAKYPARNSPAVICGLAGKLNRSDAPPVPEEQWGDIRHTLRAVTEAALKDMH